MALRGPQVWATENRFEGVVELARPQGSADRFRDKQILAGLERFLEPHGLGSAHALDLDRPVKQFDKELSPRREGLRYRLLARSNRRLRNTSTGKEDRTTIRDRFYEPMRKFRHIDHWKTRGMLRQ